jgi:hypothetical protein
VSVLALQIYFWDVLTLCGTRAYPNESSSVLNIITVEIWCGTLMLQNKRRLI